MQMVASSPGGKVFSSKGNYFSYKSLEISRMSRVVTSTHHGFCTSNMPKNACDLNLFKQLLGEKNVSIHAIVHFA
jgi:hypothetical protein